MVPQPPEQWDGGIGFVSKEMIQNHCPAPAPDVKVIFLFHLSFSGYISTEVHDSDIVIFLLHQLPKRNLYLHSKLSVYVYML